MNNIIKIENLTYSYDKKKNILENISCNIEKGKITTIIGKNGSGKSTLLSLITKNLKYNTSNIIIDNKSLEKYSRKQFSKKVSVVYQKNNAPDELTVYNMVSYGRLPYKKNLFSNLNKLDVEKINFALEVTELIDLKDELVCNLSGGQIQRVFIALAIAQDTEIIILDEPTNSLDIKYQKGILQLLKDFNKRYGKTIIMVLHDLNQALTYSDNIIAIKNGKIENAGEAKNFYSKKLLENIYETEMPIINENIVRTW